MSELIDTGFEAALAGEAYVHPEITATVTEVPCAPSTEPAAPEITLPTSTSTAPILLPSSAPTASPTLPTSSLTPAGVQAAKALVQLPASLDWPTMSRLARDIAMDIKERHTILKDFGLTQVQYDFLEGNNEFYRGALAAACRDWHAPLSTAERIKVEAAAILEDSLLGLGARMQNKGEGLPGVIEAAKLFAKVAGVGEREGSPLPAGERFIINIDLGSDQKISVGVEAAPSPAAPDIRPGTLPGHGKTP